MKPAASRAGFSLVELSVVVLAGSALSLAVFALCSVASRTMDMVNGHGTLQMRLALGLDTFSRDVRLATSLPNTWGAFTQDLDSAGDGLATLILQVPSINGTGQVIPGAFDYFMYTFAATAGTLVRTIDANDAAASSRATGAEPDQTLVVARDLTSVAFAVTTNPLPARPDVTITVNGARTEGQRSFSLQLVLRSALRN